MASKKSSKPVFTSAPVNGGLAPWLGIAFIVILCDQLSKIVVTKLLPFEVAHPVTSFFNLYFTYNPGAAFSMLRNAGDAGRYFFTAVGVAAVIYIIYLLRRHAGQRLFCWALSLIAGGAIGNVIDRLVYGKVVDFLDFYAAGTHFPAFNLADSAITLGAFLFIIDELRRVKKS